MNNDIEDTTKIAIEKVAEFYMRSNADIISALDGKGAGVLWTIPPGSPDSLRSAVRHLRRAHATKVRWIRRLRLQSRSEGQIEAVGVYVLPGVEQRVFRLDTCREFPYPIFRDECLITVEREMSV